MVSVGLVSLLSLQLHVGISLTGIVNAGERSRISELSAMKDVMCLYHVYHKELNETKQRLAESYSKADVDIKMNSLKDMIAELTAKVEQLTMTVNNLTTGENKENWNVAFSAYMVSYLDQQQLLINNGTYPFNHVRTNLGGHFDVAKSQFVCPVNGTYYFSFSVYSHDYYLKRATSPRLMRDDEIITADYVYNANNRHIYFTVANSVVAFCSKGQKVYVYTPHDNQAFSNEQYKQCNFSGFLLSTA